MSGDKIGDRDQWIKWDYALVGALQVIEDNTTSSGHPSWVVESERVDVLAVKSIDKFQAAIDRKTSGTKYKASPGETHRAEIKLLGGEYPTYREYIEGLIEKATDDE